MRALISKVLRERRDEYIFVFCLQLAHLVGPTLGNDWLSMACVGVGTVMLDQPWDNA